MRRNYWPLFIQEQQPTLEYLYTRLLSPEHQQIISIDEWFRFAFEQTSTFGLRSYC